MADGVVYVYAVGDAALADADLSAVTGVESAAVRVVVAGPLAALASTVDKERFSEESLRERLEDLEWLEETARAHHVVVATVAAAHALAPVRLATVYLDDDNVRHLLEENSPAFRSALDRVRGRRELGVKAFAPKRAAASSVASAPAASADRPGTAYLTRRRSERDRAAHGRQQALDAAEALHRSAATLAAASRRYPPQDPRLTGHRDEMVLNVAYLVDEAGAEALRALVRDWDDPSLRLELTGPWAPYSFATLDES